MSKFASPYNKFDVKTLTSTRTIARRFRGRGRTMPIS